jgi:hypothetical protein
MSKREREATHEPSTIPLTQPQKRSLYEVVDRPRRVRIRIFEALNFFLLICGRPESAGFKFPTCAG